MKSTKILSLIFLAVVILSCSKDDDGPVDVYDYNKANLTGTYSLTKYETKEVKTQDVNGFDVITTTVSTGDTFSVSVTFDSNDICTIDGTFRIVEVKTQGTERTETSYIEVLNELTKPYIVHANTTELTLGDSKYKVSDFTRTGFRINLTETIVEENGDSTVYTKELILKK